LTVSQPVVSMTRSAQPRATVYQPGSRYVLRFEVSGEVLATFREALAKVRRDAGGSLDDDSALLLLARHVLAGPVDDGRASYQVELTVCEHCQRATQTAQGESLEVATEVAAMARCDGQRIASANSENAHVGFSRDENAADKTTTDRKRRRSPRAKQDVPPSVRRQVLRRDQHRCQVPGCKHANFVDVHHASVATGKAEKIQTGGTHHGESNLRRQSRSASTTSSLAQRYRPRRRTPPKRYAS
jgi:hypothetical protein